MAHVFRATSAGIETADGLSKIAMPGRRRKYSPASSSIHRANARIGD